MRVFVVIVCFIVGLSANTIENAIVKIVTVSKSADYRSPWNVSIHQSSGSGSIIKGHRILTNAHVVANATFIEVIRHGETKHYKASVEYVSHQADLALLKVEDSHFFDAANALEFGSLPALQDRVNVYGFPMGGNSLSVSSGVVSRVEDNQYVHSKERFLAIQIDAAINPGSSGGPAINNGKIVGIVMQEIKNSQNIGYLVPTPVIEHFLRDVQDGHNDGFAELGFEIQRMQNPAIRSVYGMEKKQSGVRVFDIAPLSNAAKVLQENDILLSIDGHPIGNDGTIVLQDGIRTLFTYYTDMKQLGDNVHFKVLRHKKILDVVMQLRDRADDLLLVGSIEHDTMPRYTIYGGYVFVPLTRNLLMRSRMRLLDLRLEATKWATQQKQEDVLLLRVLADESNRGNQDYSYFLIDTIDGHKVKNFQSFVKYLHSEVNQDKIILRNDRGMEIVIDRQKAHQREAIILRNYSIAKRSQL